MCVGPEPDRYSTNALGQRNKRLQCSEASPTFSGMPNSAWPACRPTRTRFHRRVAEPFPPVTTGSYRAAQLQRIMPSRSAESPARSSIPDSESTEDRNPSLMQMAGDPAGDRGLMWRGYMGGAAVPSDHLSTGTK
jgi:hypothetical protein